MEPIINLVTPNLKTAYDLYKPIRKYCYSLLFSKPSKSGQAIVIDEIVYEASSKKTKSIKIFVEPLQENLEILWRSTREDRLHHFLQSLKADRLSGLVHSKNVDIMYRLPCCVLHYMLQRSLNLTKIDLLSFLITFINVRESNKSSRKREKLDWSTKHVGFILLFS